MNHLKKALYAVLAVMFAVVAFSSCDKNEGLLQLEVNHTTASSELSATRQGGMRSSSLTLVVVLLDGQKLSPVIM